MVHHCFYFNSLLLLSMQDLAKYRRFFPITNTEIYFNHAAISPLSQPVVKAIKSAVTHRSQGMVDTFELMLDQKKKLKTNIATLIQAQPEDIALVTNTSEGLNWFANGWQWQRGDRIVLVRDEFPTNIYPFMNLTSQGVELDYVSPREGHIYPEDIEKLISERTRLLSISFVEFFTGFRNDLVHIGEICKQHNIMFSVDGIQGVGAIPIDVNKAQIDFLANGGHKWLMSPMGCGFLYIRPEILAEMRPVFAGWLSVKDSWNFSEYNLDFLDDAERFEIGTPNFLGMTGARAATDILAEIGPEKIYTHLLNLGDVLITGLEQLGFQYIGSRIVDHRSGIYTFKTQDEEALFKYLLEHHVHVALRQGAVRISPHFYNTEDEVQQLIDLCRTFYNK